MCPHILYLAGGALPGAHLRSNITTIAVKVGVSELLTRLRNDARIWLEVVCGPAGECVIVVILVHSTLTHIAIEIRRPVVKTFTGRLSSSISTISTHTYDQSVDTTSFIHSAFRI